MTIRNSCFYFRGTKKLHRERERKLYDEGFWKVDNSQISISSCKEHFLSHLSLLSLKTRRKLWSLLLVTSTSSSTFNSHPSTNRISVNQPPFHLFTLKKINRINSISTFYPYKIEELSSNTRYTFPVSYLISYSINYSIICSKHLHLHLFAILSKNQTIYSTSPEELEEHTLCTMAEACFGSVE